MSSIFTKRVAFKPYEYPEVLAYKDAINHSYWLVSEWNFLSDIHDFNVKLNDSQKNAVKNTLLAISQIEVSVKKFWTKLGERFPKAEFEFVGVTCGESECFDKLTEVLTNNGWKLFKDLDKSDMVAQFNIKDNSIDFVVPINYIEKQYDGMMHHYHSDDTDLMVTPNHEILLMHPRLKKYFKKKSSDGIWSRNYRYPLAGKANGKNSKKFSNVDRLLIAIQADGSIYGDRGFSFNKKKKRVKSLLNSLNINYEESTTEIKALLPESIEVDINQIKNFGYINMEEIDYDYCVRFMEGVKLWDSKIKREYFKYKHSNLEAVDKVQAIACLANLSTNKIRKSGSLNINIHNKKIYPDRSEVPYNDKVYCVEVPSGAIVTRRNRHVAISGNCRHAEAYSHLLQVLNLNNDFSKLLEVPAIQGRVDYLSKYLKNSNSSDNKDYLLTLTLFSLFIENISLFSQFIIIKSFNKHMNVLKDIDNVIQATQKEETIHALLGVYIVNQIKKENPEWFNDSFYDRIYKASKKAFMAEAKIVDWIFEEGELDFLSKDTIKEFIKDRFNESIRMIGGKDIFDIDKSKLENVKWFNDEIYAEVNTDFFHKRPVSYSKKMQPITSEDLF